MSGAPAKPLPYSGAAAVAKSIAPILVTGGAGFIGCNLAARLAAEGEHVVILDSLARPGVEENLDWLRRRHARNVSFARADVRDAAAVSEAVRDAAGVVHLAAQVAVTTSLADPRSDLDVNLLGTLNVLEAARGRTLPPPVVLASTNKVYGCLDGLPVARGPSGYEPLDREIARHGISEQWPLAFHTPYGCSKGAADQYVLDYAATFGLATVVLRMSCIFGPRQCGSEDQGWVAHFAARALAGGPIAIFGDGAQVRDVLYVDDAVEAYVRALRRAAAISGSVFNLGGGPANAVSLLQVIEQIAGLVGRRPTLSFGDWRSGDQRYFVSDTRRINAALGLPRPRPWRQGLALLVEHMRDTGIAAGARSGAGQRIVQEAQ